MTAEYPHAYKEQRRLEKAARADRDRTLELGGKLPPVCGWLYRPRQGRSNPNAPRPETVCMRVAGAGTKHRGSGFCDYHEIESMKSTSRDGGVQTAKAFAYKNAKFFGEPINIGPHEALLNEVQRTAGIVAWLEDKLKRLTDDGIPEEGVLTQFSKQNGIVPSVWMILFQQEREHLVKVSTAAIKAGVAERKVQIAEQQARLIAHVMMAFLHDPELGLTPGQLMAAPAIVRKHMIAVTSLDGGRHTEGVLEATFEEKDD